MLKNAKTCQKPCSKIHGVVVPKFPAAFSGTVCVTQLQLILVRNHGNLRQYPLAGDEQINPLRLNTS